MRLRVSLTGLMAVAGMTQGGFYKHFASKAQLVAESTTASVEALVDELESLPAEPGVAGAFKTMVNGYLSQSHRESDKGCPYAGLDSELSRGDDDVRNAAVAGFEPMDVTGKLMSRGYIELGPSELPAVQGSWDGRFAARILLRGGLTL